MVEFLKPMKPPKGLEAVYNLVRQHVEPIEQDRNFHNDIKAIRRLIDNQEVVKACEAAAGKLK